MGKQGWMRKENRKRGKREREKRKEKKRKEKTKDIYFVSYL